VLASKITMKSNIRAVKKAAHGGVDEAIKKALDAGEAEAEKRLERVDDTKGYNLPIDISQEHGPLNGKIEYAEWYGRFFEYGTVFIPASPFMRPAHRKMRSVFKSVMADDFEGYIRRHAGVR
jgi:HK97 gp10 family phage protein